MQYRSSERGLSNYLLTSYTEGHVEVLHGLTGVCAGYEGWIVNEYPSVSTSMRRMGYNHHLEIAGFPRLVEFPHPLAGLKTPRVLP